MLYVSSVLGGPELHDRALAALLCRIARERPAWALHEGKPSLEVVFYLPGSKYQPEFSGARTGRYSRELGRLMVQVAVPAAQVEAHDPVPFVSSALREAVKMAGAYFKRRKRAFPGSEFDEMLDLLDARLAGGPK